eukprot:SAG22_NODE_2695_length_2306_cov_1.042139_3_plen_299_part_00
MRGRAGGRQPGNLACLLDADLPVGPWCTPTAQRPVLACLLGCVQGTAFAIGRTPGAPYESFCRSGAAGLVAPLAGLRIGVCREYMDKAKFSVIDTQNIEAIEAALGRLAALGATIVEPPTPGLGLFTPTIRRCYPKLANKLFAKGTGKGKFSSSSSGKDEEEPEEEEEEAEEEGADSQLETLLQMADDTDLVPADLSILSLDSTQLPGEGTYMLEQYLRRRGDANISTIEQLMARSRFFEDKTFFDPKRGLERRLEATELDSGTRMQFRYGIGGAIVIATAIAFACVAHLPRSKRLCS